MLSYRMAVRLPRELAAMSVAGMWFGRALFAVGLLLVIAGLVFDRGLAVLGAGLAVLGAVGALVGAHRSRRPVRHVEIAAGTITLRPEGRRHAIGDLGELVVIEWTFKRTDPTGLPVEVHRAGVRSRALDCELYLGETRAECAAWLARFEDALAGRPAAADVAVRPVDRLLEAPPAALVAAWAVFTLATFALINGLYLADAPGRYAPLGAAALVLAAVWGWAGVGRRGVAALVGFVGAGALAARPFAAPLGFEINGVTEPLGPFAEPHLVFLIGGAGLALATLAATRRLGARTAS